MARLKEVYNTDIAPKLKEELGLANVMEVPRILKVTLNMGVGEALGDKKALENAVADLTLISGQKPVIVAKPEYDVDLTNLAKKLTDSGFSISIIDGSLHIEAAQEASATINRMAFEAGITLASISIVLPTLEETFFEMTGDDK